MGFGPCYRSLRRGEDKVAPGGGGWQGGGTPSALASRWRRAVEDWGLRPEEGEWGVQKGGGRLGMTEAVPRPLRTGSRRTDAGGGGGVTVWLGEHTPRRILGAVVTLEAKGTEGGAGVEDCDTFRGGYGAPPCRNSQGKKRVPEKKNDPSVAYSCELLWPL